MYIILRVHCYIVFLHNNLILEVGWSPSIWIQYIWSMIVLRNSVLEDIIPAL